MPNRHSMLLEHTTPKEARQSTAAPRPFPESEERDATPSVRAVTSWEGGFTSFPNALFRHYTRLGISEGELVFVQQLWTFWWGDRLPFPALDSIAARMGKKIRQVQHYARALSDRGLLVIVPRADTHGRQLSNAYDLRPLLRALAAITEVQTLEGGREQRRRPARASGSTSKPRTGTVAPLLSIDDQPGPVPSAPATGRMPDPTTPRNLAPGGVWDSAGKENEQEQQKLDLGSISRAAACWTSAPPKDETPSVSEALVVRLALAPFSTRFGDEAPRASGARAFALVQRHGVCVPEFTALVRSAADATQTRLPWVERRTPDERVNAMPYFFAILERMLADRAKPECERKQWKAAPPRRPTGGTPRPGGQRQVAAEGGDRSADRLPDNPFWQAVVGQLRRFVAPGAVSRVSAATVLEASTARLCLEVSSAGEKFWCERMVRDRLMEALTDLGHGGCELLFVEATVEPRLCRDIPMAQAGGQAAMAP